MMKKIVEIKIYIVKNNEKIIIIIKINKEK